MATIGLLLLAQAALASAPDQSRPARLIEGDITTSDYPRAARRARQVGVTTVRYRIETDGRIRRCEIAASSGSALLDETACMLLTRRALYEPALGPDGRPRWERRTRRVQWRLPGIPMPVQAPELFDWTPGRLRVTRITTRDDSFCTVDVEGTAFTDIAASLCMVFPAPAAADLANEPQLRDTIVLSMAPDGMPPLPALAPPPPPGAPFVTVAADFEVDAAGAVTSCRPLARPEPTSVPEGFVQPPHPCDTLLAQGGTRVMPAIGARRGRLELEVYQGGEDPRPGRRPPR